jgi:hypothetical protein
MDSYKAASQRTAMEKWPITSLHSADTAEYARDIRLKSFQKWQGSFLGRNLVPCWLRQGDRKSLQGA